jgi:glycolate oxidase
VKTFSPQRNPEGKHRLEAAFREIFDEAIRLRGVTITGEHGIGLAKKPFLAKFAGEAPRVLRELRQVLDPNGILNPGKMFDAQPLASVAAKRRK